MQRRGKSHTLPTVATAESHPETPGERLRAALEAAEPKMSQRALARALVGEQATDAQVENMRRQIARWVKGENVPTRASSKRIATILGGTEDDYTSSGEERRGWVDQLRAVASVVDDLSRLVEDHEGVPSGDVGRLERRLAAVEKMLAALQRGQKSALDGQEKVRDELAMLQRTLDARLPEPRAGRRKGSA